jgi:deazaflavin-dependent oxidoreductase (nitroreductase family)
VRGLGRGVAHFNRRVTNRLMRPLARRLPGFGVVIHRGRTSGREYSTPVNVFAADAGFTIALTYGKRADWVQNVLAAGGCDLVTRGRRVHLAGPTVVHDESRRPAAAPARPILRLLGVADFLRLERRPDPVR